MTRSLVPAFTRAVRRFLAVRPVRTPSGEVVADTRRMFFGSRWGRHATTELWVYRRRRTVHEMLFGFVPYGQDPGLFTSVSEIDHPLPSGVGASIQLNLAAPPGLSVQGRRLVLGHSGRVTRGRGALGEQLRIALVNAAAPEAAELLGGIESSTWPIDLGSTDDLGAMFDRMFVYAFAIEQAKRLHSQHRSSATRSRPLLPPLGSRTAVEDDDGARDPRGPRQGYSLTPEERHAVELHAEDLAVTYFVSDGYRVRRVGKPYDLECTRGGEVLHVEVKGTTGTGDAIELTIGEVRHARAFARVALFVVSGVTFDRSRRPRGGTPWLCDPWHIAESALTPIRFTYLIDRAQGQSPR